MEKTVLRYKDGQQTKTPITDIVVTGSGTINRKTDRNGEPDSEVTIDITGGGRAKRLIGKEYEIKIVEDSVAYNVSFDDKIKLENLLLGYNEAFRADEVPYDFGFDDCLYVQNFTSNRTTTKSLFKTKYINELGQGTVKTFLTTLIAGDGISLTRITDDYGNEDDTYLISSTGGTGGKGLVREITSNTNDLIVATRIDQDESKYVELEFNPSYVISDLKSSSPNTLTITKEKVDNRTIATLNVTGGGGSDAGFPDVKLTTNYVKYLFSERPKLENINVSESYIRENELNQFIYESSVLAYMDTMGPNRSFRTNYNVGDSGFSIDASVSLSYHIANFELPIIKADIKDPFNKQLSDKDTCISVNTNVVMQDKRITGLKLPHTESTEAVSKWHIDQNVLALDVKWTGDVMIAGSLASGFTTYINQPIKVNDWNNAYTIKFMENVPSDTPPIHRYQYFDYENVFSEQLGTKNLWWVYKYAYVGEPYLRLMFTNDILSTEKHVYEITDKIVKFHLPIDASDQHINNIKEPQEEHQAATKQYADSILLNVPYPSEDSHAANKKYVDDNKGGGGGGDFFLQGTIEGKKEGGTMLIDTIFGTSQKSPINTTCAYVINKVASYSTRISAPTVPNTTGAFVTSHTHIGLNGTEQPDVDFITSFNVSNLYRSHTIRIRGGASGSNMYDFKFDNLGLDMGNKRIVSVGAAINNGDALNKFVLYNEKFEVNTSGSGRGYPFSEHSFRRSTHTSTGVRIYRSGPQTLMIEDAGGESSGLSMQGDSEYDSADGVVAWAAGDGDNNIISFQDEDSQNARVSKIDTQGDYYKMSSKLTKDFIRIKANNNVLNRFLKLKVCSYGRKYEYRENPTDKQTKRIDNKRSKMEIGLILEDVWEIFPNAISGYTNKLHNKKSNRKRILEKEVKNVKDQGICYNNILLYFIIAFQEYVGKIENRLKLIESKIGI